MRLLMIFIGIILCVYSLYVLKLRLKGDDNKFRKLKAMRLFWGEKIGSAIHYIGYVIIPFLFGILLLFSAISGVNIFE